MSPLRVRGCRIGPTCLATCRKRRLSRGNLFAVGCDPYREEERILVVATHYFGLYFSLDGWSRWPGLDKSAGHAKP